MEFTDNTTPSFQDYVQQYERIPYNTLTVNGIPAGQYRDLMQTWEQMYYPNAFQAAMLNYQNEYEKPINQMLRYQEAGLNPYSFQHQQSASGSQGAAPKQMLGNQELSQKRISNVISGISSISGALGVAKELYDYLAFGKERSFQQTQLTRASAEAAQFAADIKQAEAAWSNYWDFGADMAFPDHPEWTTSKSPRATYMLASTNRIKRQIAQVDYMIKELYPSQKDANEARAALQKYQKEILAGHNDAVLNINTGNPVLDSIFKFLMYLVSENLPTGSYKIQ